MTKTSFDYRGCSHTGKKTLTRFVNEHQKHYAKNPAPIEWKGQAWVGVLFLQAECPCLPEKEAKKLAKDPVVKVWQVVKGSYERDKAYG